MSIVDVPIDEVEDVTENDRCQRHTAPILAQALDAKSLGNKSWIDAEEEAVGQACKSRDKPKDMGIFSAGTANLRSEKDAAGDEKAPEARHSELSYYDVRANP